MCNSRGCSCFAIILGLILGIAIAVLFVLGLIPDIVTASWIVFGLAVLFLILLTGLLAVASSTTAIKECFCSYGSCLLIGIIGSIITSIIALAITLTPGPLLITILVFLAGTFFSLMLISFFGLLNCILGELCGKCKC